MRIHIVRPGDTLWKLANQYNVPLQRLIDANPQIKDPDQLEVGMKVRIPTGGVPVQPPVTPKKPTRPRKPDHKWPDRKKKMPPKYGVPKRPELPRKPGKPWLPHHPMYGGMHDGCCYPMNPPRIPDMGSQYPGMGCYYPGMGYYTPMMPYPMYGMPYPEHYGTLGYREPYMMEPHPWMTPVENSYEPDESSSSSSST